MDEEVTKHAPARDTRRLVRRLAPGGCECCAAGTMKNPTDPSTCDGCSHSFDEHCVPEVECPECGQDERVISRKIWEHYRRADVTTEICPGSGLELAVDAVGNVMRKQTVSERRFAGPVPGGFVPMIETTWPDAEARELAGRMALDEAAEGDFGAAAELKAFADAPPEVELRHHAGDCVLLLLGGKCSCGAAAKPRSFAAGGPVEMRGEAGPELLFPLRPGQLQVGVALEPIATGGEGIVMLGGQPQALTTMDSWRAAFAADLRRLLPQVTDAKLHADHVTALAGAMVECGWAPGAKRRAAELPKATAALAVDPLAKYAVSPHTGKPLADDDNRYEDQPITDADGAVIGHVWELPKQFLLEHPREWVAAVDDNRENRPRFSSRDGAEAWVRANAPRDGRPLTVPYDAEKVLGLKGAVVGWVWLDPEHAGDDGRWLAVHGAHPEHQHPLFGSKGSGLDARNQAIGWVLEQDKAARS